MAPTSTGPLLRDPLGKITEPVIVELKDGSKGTIYPIYSVDEIPESLLKFMHQEMNDEIERGNTYPIYDILSQKDFADYWFFSFVAIMIKGENPGLQEDSNWESEFLGTYYVKPNYPGRCSHICNAGFVVNPRIRGQNIGTTLGKNYLNWAPILGYTYSVFNLVFETNVASSKIWDNLGFERIGYVKKAAVLKGYDEPIGAIIYGKDLV